MEVRMKILRLVVWLTVTIFLASAWSQDEASLVSPSPEGAEAYFIILKNGDKVKSPVTVHFGLKGMGIAPAGVERENTGHNHLLINEPEIDLSLPLPSTDQIKHFGGGQTEVMLELEPGPHTLQILLGDHSHIPHDPPVMSEKITIVIY